MTGFILFVIGVVVGGAVGYNFKDIIAEVEEYYE